MEYTVCKNSEVHISICAVHYCVVKNLVISKTLAEYAYLESHIYIYGIFCPKIKTFCIFEDKYIIFLGKVLHGSPGFKISFNTNS
jgi:hypothetical protein